MLIEFESLADLRKGLWEYVDHKDGYFLCTIKNGLDDGLEYDIRIDDSWVIEDSWDLSRDGVSKGCLCLRKPFLLQRQLQIVTEDIIYEQDTFLSDDILDFIHGRDAERKDIGAEMAAYYRGMYNGIQTAQKIMNDNLRLDEF
jgi:hypothetical protein